MGAEGVGEHVTDVAGVLLDEAEPGLGLGEGVVPVAAGEAGLGDGPVVERKAGEVAGLFRPRPASLQHDFGLVEAIAVGEGRAEPQLTGEVVGPGGVAALGDGHRPLGDGDCPVDETLGQGHDGQGLQSQAQRVVVAQPLAGLDGPFGLSRGRARAVRPTP